MILTTETPRQTATRMIDEKSGVLFSPGEYRRVIRAFLDGTADEVTEPAPVFLFTSPPCAGFDQPIKKVA